MDVLYKSLIKAIDEENLQKIESIIKENNHILNDINEDSLTPLMYATELQKNKSAIKLIELRADVTITDDVEKTPLMSAGFWGSKSVVSAIIEKMPNEQDDSVLNAQDYRGITALSYASMQGHSSIVGELLKKGANHSIANDEGFSPLLYAANYGHKEVIKKLIEYGADIKQENENVENALMLAVQGKNKDCAELLIKAGSDINSKNIWGQTPLMIAVQNEDLETVKILVKNKAEIGTEDLFNNTALSFAKKLENKEIESILKKRLEKNVHKKSDNNVDNKEQIITKRNYDL